MLRFRLLRFAGVGAASTLLYAVTALSLTTLGHVGAMKASLIAYLLAAILSYAGHRYLTFRSTGSHRREAPRFALLALSGFGVALSVPLIVSNVLALPAAVSVFVTCGAVPTVSYVVMARKIFTAS